jgi:hypothetical protein
MVGRRGILSLGKVRLELAWWNSMYRWSDIRWEGIIYLKYICIDPLVLESFEMIMTRIAPRLTSQANHSHYRSESLRSEN